MKYYFSKVLLLCSFLRDLKLRTESGDLYVRPSQSQYLENTLVKQIWVCKAGAIAAQDLHEKVSKIVNE